MYLNNAEPHNYEKDLIETLQFIFANGDIWHNIIQFKDINSKNEKNQTFLHFAIAQHRIDAANDLISKGADVNAADEDGKTPIFLAAEKKHWGLVLASLGRIDFTLLKENKKNFTHLAYEQNQTEAILKILDKYKEGLNIRDSSGNTPILIAAKNEHWELVLKLRELKDVDVSISNEHNETLAHFACEKNQIGLVLDLIKDNKDCLSIPGRFGRTPLLYAAKNGHWDLIEEVIEKSEIDDEKLSELNKPNKLHETLLQLACKDNKDEVALKLITLNDFNAEISDENGQTILHLFCQNNQILLTLEIIKKMTGKDVDYPDKKGNTPALLAAEKGHWTLINRLIESEFLDLETSKHRNDFVKLSIRDNEMELALKLINKDNINSSVDDYDNTPALLAAKQGHWDLVRKLMQFDGFNYDQQNEDKEALLHFACRSNEVDLALQLVNKDNINYPDKHGNTPGLLAAENGHWDLVRKLMKEKGFQIGLTSGAEYGNSLLHFACEYNEVDLVFELIEKKANINFITGSGFTPVSSAAKNGHWDLVIKLIKYKVKKQDNFTGQEIKDILNFACKKNKVDVVFELTKKQNLDMGSRECLKAAENRSWEIVKILLNYKNYNVNEINRKNETLLHLACQDNKKELVFELITRGANLNSQDKDGDTPVLRAARSGHFDLVTEIFEDSYVNYKNKYKKTLLHFACQHNKTDFVLHLLKKGAKINFEDNEKNTAILIAAGNGHWDLVSKLIEKNDCLKNVNVFKETLLHLACRDNQETLAENLINSGLDVNFLNTYKRSPIFFAAENSHWDLVQKLIELNADPNIPDKDGTTVLHFACRDGREDIALMLIRKGADPIATDTYGISPLDLANRNEHNHLVEEILNLDKEDE